MLCHEAAAIKIRIPPDFVISTVHPIDFGLGPSILTLDMLSEISSQAESTSTMRQRKQSVGGFIFLFDSFAVLGDSFIHE